MFGLKSLAKKRKRLKKHNSSASWGGGIDPGTLTINPFLASKMKKSGGRRVKGDTGKGLRLWVADSYGVVSI